MNRKLKFSLFTFLAVCTLISVAVGMSLRPRTSAELSVQLVGNSYHGDTTRTGIRIASPESHFHVVLRNESAETTRLWEEWNPWGFFNLTFELFDSNEKSLGEIQKIPISWTRNFPSFLELKPKQIHVIDVYLNPITWNMPIKPMGNREGPNKYNLVVTYSVPKCAESDKHGVWVGSLKSKPIPITFGYWPNPSTHTEIAPPKPSDSSDSEG